MKSVLSQVCVCVCERGVDRRAVINDDSLVRG